MIELTTSYECIYGKGKRNDLITVTASPWFLNQYGSSNALIDGGTSDGINTYQCNTADKWIKFEFKHSVVVDEIKIYRQVEAHMGDWKIEGSNNDSDWETLVDSVTIRESTEIVSFKNFISYKFIKFSNVKGVEIGKFYMYEFEFKSKVIYAKYLIKDNGYLYKIADNKIINLGDKTPTKELFLEHGSDGIEISHDILARLNDPKVLVYSPIDDVSNLTINAKQYPFINGKKILYFSSEKEECTFNTDVIPIPQLIEANGDIVHNDVESIDKVKCTCSANVKIIVSNDSGDTWYTYDTETNNFKPIDKNDIYIVDTYGMTPDVFNNIDKWSEFILNTNKTCRAAYLIKDEEYLDELSIEITLKGNFKQSKLGEDYNIKYADEDRMIVKILKDGTYKINNYHLNEDGIEWSGF